MGYVHRRESMQPRSHGLSNLKSDPLRIDTFFAPRTVLTYWKDIEDKIRVSAFAKSLYPVCMETFVHTASANAERPGQLIVFEGLIKMLMVDL